MAKDSSKPKLHKRRPHLVVANVIKIRLPRWSFLFYACGAAILLPWTIYLSIKLPTRELSRDWDVVWAGFDIFIIFLMALTAYFAARKSIWIILSASALGTSLLVDGWFDVLTSRPGTDKLHSLLLAIFVELPVALISWHIAGQVAHQFSKLAKNS